MKNKLLICSTIICMLASTALTGCSLNPLFEKKPETIKASAVYTNVNSQINSETPLYITYSVEENGQTTTYFTGDTTLIEKCVQAFNELELAQLELIPNEDHGSVITFYGSADQYTGKHQISRIVLEDGYFMYGQACFVSMSKSLLFDEAFNELTQTGTIIDYSAESIKNISEFDGIWEGTNRLSIYLDFDGCWYLDTIERTEPEFTTVSHEKILNISNNAVTVKKEDGTTYNYSFSCTDDYRESFVFDNDSYFLSGID